MKTVYGYVRVSSKGQADKDGPERQRESIQQFCDAHALKVTAIELESISGTTEGLDRPAFQDMLAKISNLRRNGVDVVGIVVERMDRLARDLMVSEVLLAQCRKHKVKVYAADQEALLDMAAEGADPTRVLVRQLMAALAQWEKAVLVRKLRAARERKKAETGRCDGIKPYGFYEGEQEMIDYMITLFQQTPRMSYRQMELHLFQTGLRQRNGRPWTCGAIRVAIKSGIARKQRQ